MEPKHAKKKGLHRKNVTFLRNQKKRIAQISLIQMTSEKPSHFAFKTRTENCKGDVNAWSRGLFQLADRDFRHECPNCYCFFKSCLNMKSEKKPRAKTAAKLITTVIDFLNNISAGHTSLIQVYRCY